VRALSHQRTLDSRGIEVVHGDAADPAALEQLITDGSVVLNLVHGAEALAHALAKACAQRGVRRLVHVSTCSVYGIAPGERVDEDTPCLPVTLYERSKHAVEGILERDARCPLVILRPTAVFGPGGTNLETLALRVLRQPWPWRYLRACAMGRRRMHAVDVDCVAAAALFLAAAPLEAQSERFIVSQDEEPDNNYASLEAFFVRRFGAARYPLAPLPLPRRALRWALRAAGRSNVEPLRVHSAARLARRGFAPPRGFATALEEYADWILGHARP
jgi:nucleoside-diphosphate-sugar epimerase